MHVKEAASTRECLIVLVDLCWHVCVLVLVMHCESSCAHVVACHCHAGLHYTGLPFQVAAQAAVLCCMAS